ncbi:MAG: pyridoxal phosphate-dependent aminotransferase [Candidatus Bathyarchaeia archaeon]|nr:pyridoxal phosphate-dependent aminotransferase [Candidatus Bathyarchaeota archaeon]
MQNFLLSSIDSPAIRVAINKAALREDKGLPIFDFSSGNIGKLPSKINLFNKIDIEVNENLPSELKVIAEAIKEGILEAYYPNPKCLSYSPTGGNMQIRKLAIKYFKEVHGVPLTEKDFDKVMVTAGGQQAMAAALRSLKSGIKVFLSQWEYDVVPAIVKDRGGKVIRIKRNEDLSINIEELKEKIVEDSVFYISMPNNPTGYVSTQDFEEILQVLTEKNGGVIWDAPYLFTILKLTPTKAEFDKNFLQLKIEEFKKIIKKYYESMCIVSSLSKTCLMAGLRFGFATASSHWIKIMEAFIGRETLSSPTLGFIIGAKVLQAFLKNQIVHEWACKIIAKRLTILIEEGFPLILPKNGAFGALYALVETNNLNSVKLADKLINKYGIVAIPGEPFYGKQINVIRLSLAATPWSENDEEWIKAVKTLKKALT